MTRDELIELLTIERFGPNLAATPTRDLTPTPTEHETRTAALIAAYKATEEAS